MKGRNPLRRGLPAFLLVCGLLPAFAQAQFTQQAKLIGTGAIGLADQGWSVSLSRDGNTAIVGGIDDNSSPNCPGVGAAWVYTRSGGVWSQQAKLVGTGAIGDALQGYSVSLSADGSTAIIGGPRDNGSIGAAWVFTQPVFAGASGKPDCIGKSVSALAQQYGGLAHAAAALGYSSINALQIAIADYCGR